MDMSEYRGSLLLQLPGQDISQVTNMQWIVGKQEPKDQHVSEHSGWHSLVRVFCEAASLLSLFREGCDATLLLTTHLYL